MGSLQDHSTDDGICILAGKANTLCLESRKEVNTSVLFMGLGLGCIHTNNTQSGVKSKYSSHSETKKDKITCNPMCACTFSEDIAKQLFVLEFKRVQQLAQAGNLCRVAPSSP